jgi:putative SOS response-associated peptidase YedK
MMLDPGYRTGPAVNVGDPGAVIRRKGEVIEMVNLIWGFPPSEPGGRRITLIRSEGRRFASHRCLIPASEFHFLRDEVEYRFILANRDFFYFAGIWRPRTPDWPEAYAVLTIPANPDVAPYHDRQMAVLKREDRMAWLDGIDNEEELLKPLPANSLHAEAEGGGAFSHRQHSLAL